MANNVVNRPSFFFVIAIVGLLAVVIGFAKTFFLQMSAGTFMAPLSIYIHGSFAFAWVILYFVQTTLIHYRKYHVHRTLGILGLIIAAGLTVTMVPVGLYVVDRELNQGLGPAAYSTLLGTITSGIMFFALVLAGMLKRKKPETHKRLMLLATIVVLWPAWFRFRHYFPSVPRPEIWFALVLADSLIVFSWIWDRLKNGVVHPVLGYGGLLIILEQAFEVIAFDTPPWQMIAKGLYRLLEQIG
ncbi:MAG: hypothetical protein ABIQ31_16345 [Ferruginibacter sp.]